MYSSQADPTLSIVVGCTGAPGAVEACLSALEPQADGAEVLVCEGSASTAELRRRFRFALFLDRPHASVPLLWRDGIDASRGAIVALTSSNMEPAPDWVETILAQLQTVDVVAGAIEPGRGGRLSEWAEYFCRYSHDALPFERHVCVAELPGDNIAYRRKWLERTRELYRDGFVEPFVNRTVADQGAELRHEPSVVVRQHATAGARAFLAQRLEHGRDFGARRGEAMGRSANFLRVAAAPAVPFALTVRLLRRLLPRRRFRKRLVASLPLVLAFNVAWAAGEAAGHLDALRER